MLYPIKNFMKKRYLAFGLMVTTLFLSSCADGGTIQTSMNASGGDEMKVYKVGIVTPLTGDAAVIGTEYQRVLDYQLEKVNSSLAEHNAKIELIYEDGKCGGNDAVSAFQKLTDIDGAKIVFGTCSAETLAMAPLANSKNVLLLSSLSSSPEVAHAGDNVFSFSFSDSTVGNGIAKELSKYAKVALINEQNDFNVGVKKVVTDALNASGNTQIVASEDFPTNQRDFRNSLAKIKEANPDALLVNPFPGVTAENLLKQIGEDSYWKDVKLISHIAYLSKDSRSSAPDLTEGLVLFDAPSISNTDFETIYNDITQQKGTLEDIGKYYTAASIDSLNILGSLLGKYGDDVSAIKEALRSQEFSGYIGDKLTFSKDNFVDGVEAVRYVVKDGETVKAE